MASSLLTGLYAYYALEGSGQPTFGGHTSSIDNSVSFSTSYGKIKQGASYSGSASYTTLGFNAGLLSPQNTSCSISFWCYFPSTTAANQGIVVGANSAGGNNVMYFYTAVGNKIGFGVGGASFDYEIDAGSITTGTWYHIVGVATYTSSSVGTIALYINNVQVGSTTAYTPSNVTTNSGSGYALGRFGSYNGDYFTGYVDEVGFWNKALTTTEINTLWNSGNGLTYPFLSNSGMFNFFLK